MLPDQRRVILYPQDLSVIYRFVMKYSALPRHPCYALVAEVWPLTVYSELIWSLRRGTWVDTTWLWSCGAPAVRHDYKIESLFFYSAHSAKQEYLKLT